MSTVSVNLRLRRIEDFFRDSGLDPLSEWYEAYSELPAVEYVAQCVSDDPGTERVEIVVGVPAAGLTDGAAQRLKVGITRYCDAHLTHIERASRESSSRGWLMLAFTIVVVAFFVWVAHRLADSSVSAFTIGAEGLSIAAWVLLWHPLEALVFTRWDFRLDRRVLRTLRDRSEIHVETLVDPPPLDA